jgi:hypothetical protein
MSRLIAVIVAGAALSMLTTAGVFAQAGSTGGTIGNQDKSISGGQDQGQTHQKPNTKRRNSVSADMPVRFSVSGKWAWTAKCDDGSEWAGTFDFAQNTDGTISGTASGNDGSGSISGRLNGNNLTGSRSYWDHSNQIILTFAAGGSSLQGSEPSRTHGVCRYQARRT